MSGTTPVAPLTSAEIVDVRRFLGYPQTSEQSVSPSQLAQAINAFFQTTDSPLTTNQVTAVINALIAQNTPIVNDPVSLALAALDGDMITVVRNVYLVPLNTFEQALIASNSGLNINKADVYTRNLMETHDRDKLFRSWRIRFAYFLGVPTGPFLYTVYGGPLVAV